MSPTVRPKVHVLIRQVKHSDWGKNDSGEKAVNVELSRAHLREMSDVELLRYGKTAREMCSPAANCSKPPRQIFMAQLEEVRDAWKRRHPES